MQRQRQIVTMSGGLTDADQIVSTSIAEGAGCTGHDHRRAEFGSGFRHHLHGFKIMHVERRHGITLALRF
ncbi:hypothetical protein D3C80_1623910 [compost metagenome]